MTINEYINSKKVLQSNRCGPFIIIKDLGKINNRSKVLIKFINTGTERDVLFDNAINHRVLDPALNTYSNDFDVSRFDNYDKYIDSILKMTYKHMLDRCYNSYSEKYRSYGEIGIAVCDRWLNDINAFLYDARFIDNFEKFYNAPYLYQLDKDYKQLNIPKNKRIYSLETCIFLYYQDNTNLKIIENKTPGSYYGVEKTPNGNYHARMRINNYRIDIGTFTNPIAAANAYNSFQLKYHNYELVPLLNDVPYMDPTEFIKYNARPKNMCSII